ncbi:hypothetical protein C8Q74DRAFT_1238194 [Fomes fomentarius]|nr:hypothetical protein C8Q74DRAFT_1238194 [Fomes fomentarius]
MYRRPSSFIAEKIFSGRATRRPFDRRWVRRSPLPSSAFSWSPYTARQTHRTSTPASPLPHPLRAMAFAQFYYDPALEFEKLLDESEAQDNIDVPAVAVAQPHATLPGSDGSVNSLDTQSTSSVAATQPLYVGEYLFLKKGRALNVVANPQRQASEGESVGASSSTSFASRPVRFQWRRNAGAGAAERIVQAEGFDGIRGRQSRETHARMSVTTERKSL